MGSLNVFLRILVLASSLSTLTAHPLTPPVDPNAIHRVGLPPIPPESAYSVKIVPNQQPGNAESYPSSSYPFNMYHGLQNDDLLPADVELVPVNAEASSSGHKEPVLFVPDEGRYELVPNLDYTMDDLSIIPYYHRPMRPIRPVRPMRPIHPVRPLRPIRPVRPLRPLRPMRPMRPMRPTRPHRPSHYPIPQPPVWTLPPDVEIYPPEKPSDCEPSKPWYPPAIPSYWYSTSARETNQMSPHQLIADDNYNNFSRSAFDSDNVTTLQMPLSVPYTTIDDIRKLLVEQPPTDDKMYQFSDFDASAEFPLNLRLDDSEKRYEVFVIVPEENLNKGLAQYIEKSAAIRDRSGQIAPESSEPGFSIEHNAAVHDDSTFSEGASPLLEDLANSEDDAAQPVNIDMSSIDLPNMEAVLPENAQPTAAPNADEELSALSDNVTESVVDHRAYETRESNAEAQLADWVEKELKRIGLSNGRSVSGEGTVGEETEELDEETKFADLVRAELRRIGLIRKGSVSGQDTVEEDTEAKVDDRN